MKVARSIFFLLMLSAFSLLARGAILISDGPVQPGEWNSSFDDVVKEARTRHLPMMLVLENEGCSYCVRLMNALDGAAFSLWQKDRNILMTHVHNAIGLKGKLTPGYVREAIPFFRKNRKQGYPLVYVWWPKSDGTEVGKVFLGRRNVMGGNSHRFLSMEFMSAVDKVLGEYLTATTNAHRTLEQILKDCTKTISFKAGSGGTISMVPETGILPEGANVTLTGKPDAGYVLLKWSDPNGIELTSRSNLTVTGSMPEGAYTAHFKSIDSIRPPLPLPATTSIYTRVGERFSYTVKVSEESRPVLFNKIQGLPSDVMFDSQLGIMSGVPQRPGKNVLDIVIKGSDVNHTVATNRLTLIVRPKLRSPLRHKKKMPSKEMK